MGSLPNAPTLSFSSSLSATTLLPCRRFTAFPRRLSSFSVQAKIREIFMPALSSTMTEGKIVSWIKSEGDTLSKGDSVVVVESDKADMDVETFYDGILAAIVVADGETAPVGAPIGLLVDSPEEVAEAKAKAANSAPSPAPAAAPSAPATPPPPPPSPPAKSVSDAPTKTVATPQAKKLAKQHKVDIANVVGTGPFGRITPADVEAAAGISPSKSNVTPLASPAPAKAASATPSPAPIPGSSVVAFSTMQSAVAKNMVESLSVPTFRVGYPVTTDALDALYEKVKPKGVTMTAILAKAAAMALVQHPVVNASCKDGKNFVYNSNINVAVAVAINGGLITPVLQDADKLDLYLLSQKWKELVDKARAKQLQPHEYNSGTFTLSNLGMFGVDRFDAILPPGQGAIMAVGASKPTVLAAADGFFSVKNKMLVNVTADHRIIYGADLAAFLQTFSKIIENPESLTL
ncbi:dihydrolipoyllysine-residue acetyltransferase component 4 of pyruvate dehydrogenase complex, chloroplastic [Cajanus cajan]|uniref:dihydrolipoyllysine-residue acetyltransferase component 4 of pyruvate dehydrogenase complex, chloroplastic n=1 Tax=Cajanus cajan TaxID=3821 RepID=UPI00098DD55E|nr:dihydrolipoyllysine-residue acetyltransferase component 4 of pyruvate dehydrogenase complex, chloroplastic [Cajanus cajan]